MKRTLPFPEAEAGLYGWMASRPRRARRQVSGSAAGGMVVAAGASSFSVAGVFAFGSRSCARAVIAAAIDGGVLMQGAR